MSQPSSPLTRVAGFRAVGVTCGIKKSGNPDLALVLGNTDCAAAAMFTQNAFKAAPVLYDIDLLARSRTLRGVVINAGNANAVTGQQGLRDAEQMARLAEQECGLPADSVAVMSTGVIGEKLPMKSVAHGIALAAQTIDTRAGARGEFAVQAIMTTDTIPKEAFVEISIGGQLVRLAGMAKGSGMIHPDLATMLAMLVTDAVIDPPVLDTALRQAVTLSFNRVTVDGDTSTNDTVLLLASGQAGNPAIELESPEFETFVSALTELCVSLAKMIARDGEGATKLIEVTVTGAVSEAEAGQVATTIANSPLVKTAIFGGDPNWGRLLMATGRSGATIDPNTVSVWLGDFHLLAAGEPLPFEAAEASRWLVESDTVPVRIDLAVGQATATMWTCDLSYKYVEINAEYHT